MIKNTPHPEHDPLPNRLITIGCLLLAFPAIFFCFAVAFYLVPLVVYTLMGN